MKAVIDQLASSQGRKDDVPNQELATRIAQQNDSAAIKELISLLRHKNKDIQSDAIKVLYETGGHDPALIVSYAEVFVDLLSNKNNRLVWGAMTCLDCITNIHAPFVHLNLSKLLAASERGSVIAKDHFIGILIKLAAIPAYMADTLSLLLEQMQTCPTNQLPMYAENSQHVINKDFKGDFVKVLSGRLNEIEKESKRKRVEKVVTRLLR